MSDEDEACNSCGVDAGFLGSEWGVCVDCFREKSRERVERIMGEEEDDES